MANMRKELIIPENHKFSKYCWYHPVWSKALFPDDSNKVRLLSLEEVYRVCTVAEQEIIEYERLGSIPEQGYYRML